MLEILNAFLQIQQSPIFIFFSVGKKIIIIKHARVCFYFNVVVSNKLSNISHASLKSYLSEVGAARQGLEP